MRYLKNAMSRKATPQSLPIPGAGQVPNSAGGYAFPVDDWVRLDRFLVLGSEGGTYYATERALTRENAEAVVRCIQQDGPRAVARVVEISDAGRAPKNDPAIFALALAAACGEPATRRAALAALPQVCRIGTHLFHFAEFVDEMRGWGRGLRCAVSEWYNAMEAGRLAHQAVKYQSRDGWSHRDMLRLSHAVPPDADHAAIYHWITQGWEGVGPEPHPNEALRLLWAFERAKRAENAREVVGLIRDYRLPREAVPSEWLNDPSVWEALLEEMPLTAMIRNLATMTRVGLLGANNSPATDHVVRELNNTERLRSARMHPVAVLSALRTYAAGQGARGQNTWKPARRIVDALDRAFYASFGNVEPTGKRWVLALDVSGSMGFGTIAGVPGLTPRDASAAMAMVTAAVERQYEFVAFTSGMGHRRALHATAGPFGATGITPLDISPRQRLNDVVRAVSSLPFGGTDCALPMLWALKHKVSADVFVILTDSETWAGNIHPVQALADYRQGMGIPAKLIVVAMTSNGFSIADPNDAGMLDVVGFDTATPQLMSGFVRDK